MTRRMAVRFVKTAQDRMVQQLPGGMKIEHVCPASMRQHLFMHTLTHADRGFSHTDNQHWPRQVSWHQCRQVTKAPPHNRRACWHMPAQYVRYDQKGPAWVITRCKSAQIIQRPGRMCNSRRQRARRKRDGPRSVRHRSKCRGNGVHNVLCVNRCCHVKFSKRNDGIDSCQIGKNDLRPFRS
jgi:hypothetical protein